MIRRVSWNNEIPTVKGTASHALIYERNKEEPQLSAHCDADHSGCEDTSRSTSAYSNNRIWKQLYWIAKQAIEHSRWFDSWSGIHCCLQSSKEVFWYRMFLKGLGVGVTENGTILRVNHQSAIKWENDPRPYPNRTKHVRISDVQERFQDKEVTVGGIHSK